MNTENRNLPSSGWRDTYSQHGATHLTRLNGQSRLYFGIHWSFDKTEGIALGWRVADYIFDHALQPKHAH